MNRKIFLKEFLGALGAINIKYSKETNDYIIGTVIYDKNDSEEIQEFCWNIREDKTPTVGVLNLAKLINEEKLLDIDKISIPRDELLEKYNNKYKVSLSQDSFNKILEELESIKVVMLDNGKETDIYFIHE